MPDLVTLAVTKTKLRIFHDDYDAELEILISAASEAVINYLDTRADEVLELDPGGEIPSGVTVPYVVQAATLYLIKVLHSDSDASEQFEMGFLPKPVTAMLYPLRDPAVA